MSIASKYPNINLAEAILRRSKEYPTDVLTYELEGTKYQYTVEGGEVITKIMIMKEDRVVMSTNPNDIVSPSVYQSNINTLQLGTDIINGFYEMHLGIEVSNQPYIRGIGLDDLIPEMDYEVYMDYITGIDNNNPDSIDLTEYLEGIASMFPDSFLYPDGLNIYYHELETETLNESFKILYQLATDNRYWLPETFYLLKKPTKKLSRSVLLPVY